MFFFQAERASWQGLCLCGRPQGSAASACCLMLAGSLARLSSEKAGSREPSVTISGTTWGKGKLSMPCTLHIWDCPKEIPSVAPGASVLSHAGGAGLGSLPVSPIAGREGVGASDIDVLLAAPLRQCDASPQPAPANSSGLAAPQQLLHPPPYSATQPRAEGEEICCVLLQYSAESASPAAR